jgi:hypothetical protein
MVMLKEFTHQLWEFQTAAPAAGRAHVAAAAGSVAQCVCLCCDHVCAGEAPSA